MPHSLRPPRFWRLAFLAASAGALFLPALASAAPCTNGQIFNADDSCEVPSGVGVVQIDAWGGGAAGGNGDGTVTRHTGAGGGGGSYCGASFNVAGGTTLTIIVGSGGAVGTGNEAAGGAGGNSSVTGTGITGMTANGGTFANGGGPGGTIAGCTATNATKFVGGNGAGRLTGGGNNTNGGSGGGGSAGAGGAGGDGGSGSNTAAGTGGAAGVGSPGGAVGGAGSFNSGNGVAGTAPGGGGGGARNAFAVAGGAGAAGRVVISWSECGTGLSFTTSQWTMLALPCVPSAGTPSVANVFGTGTGSNLNTANYNTASTGWVIDKRLVGIPPAYQRLLIGDNVSIDTGYWIKSYQAPTGNTLTVAGIHATTNVTQAQGCAVAAGCRAITVTTPAATTNRFNLVGNPFAYAIDWSKVRIRVDGAAATYTPSQAAGVAVSGNASPPVLSNEVNIWNGTSYDTISDALVPPFHNLRYFQSFWVNVLPGASGQTIELLIPAEVSLFTSQVEPATSETLAAQPLPWYLGWLDWMAPPAAAQPAPQRPAVSGHVQPQALPDSSDWYVRVKVDNRVTGWQDHGLLLGQLTDAQPGHDPNDQSKMAPFAKPYLMLVFPQPGWGDKKGDYATDFRPVTGQPDTWTFEIRAEPVGSQVFLSWEGDRKIFKRSQLINVATGETIEPADPRWAKKGYPVSLDTPVKTFSWRYLGP